MRTVAATRTGPRRPARVDRRGWVPNCARWQVGIAAQADEPGAPERPLVLVLAGWEHQTGRTSATSPEITSVLGLVGWRFLWRAMFVASCLADSIESAFRSTTIVARKVDVRFEERSLGVELEWSFIGPL